jgi:adenylate cyclase class IV
MHFLEVETKYNANDISLEKFREQCKKLLPIREKLVRSYDHYFEKKKNEFIRYRAGQSPELTVKKKTVDHNNFVRIEVNVPIAKKRTEFERLQIITAFCDSLGFKHNFTIFKVCHIYYYEEYNIVYYVVYDKELREQTRLIEIEMDETYNWKDKKQAWSALLKVEKSMAALGLKKKNRVNESLYEMFRED